jgi:hypothetical protein
MGGRCSLLILRSKGQRSSALEIKIEIQSPGSRPLSLPPRVTISHILTTHGRKIFPINFEVKGQAHWISKQKYGFRALDHYPYHLESPYHTYINYPCEEDIPY